MTVARRRTFSFGTSILLFLLLAITIASVINLIFLSEITNLDSGVQEEYLIDGYYYLHLGQRALFIADRDQMSLYEAADWIRPNVSSIGIVFLSSLTNAIVPWPWLVPTFFACIYAALIVGLSWTYRIERNFAMLFLSGLVPYLYIPTKEAFFTIGLMLGLVCFRRPVLKVLVPVAACIMYLARPEAFFILTASLAAYLLLRRRSSAIIVMIMAAAVCIYWILLRDAVTATSSLFQLAAQRAETSFCSVGPLSVCIPDGGAAEHIYLQRMLSLLGLPLKWLSDILQLFLEGTLPPSAWILRIAMGMQLAAIAIALRQRIRAGWRLAPTQVVLFIFASLYISIYSAVLYYQVSRQALLALHIVLLALLLSEAPRAPRKRVNFQASPRAATNPFPSGH